MPKVLYIKKHPFGKNFLAITLTEFILTVAPLSKYDMNHEMIHVKQQRELLYLPFFMLTVTTLPCLLSCRLLKVFSSSDKELFP